MKNIYNFKNMYMQNIYERINSIGVEGINTLIVGEHGTGRDTVAKAIHAASGSSEPMICLDCDGLKEEDMQIEDGHTYYLDEVQFMTGKAQAHLRKSMEVHPAARIIASADSRLGEAMDRGSFDDRLYYPIAKARIELPGLRFRREDISTAARYFLRKYNKKYAKSARFGKGALRILKMYSYPGNLTELGCIIERAVAINKTGIIKANSIAVILDMESIAFTSLLEDNRLNLTNEVKKFEIELIVNAVRASGSMKGAAEMLSLSRTGLSKKCKSLGINLVDTLKPEKMVDDEC